MAKQSNKTKDSKKSPSPATRARAGGVSKTRKNRINVQRPVDYDQKIAFAVLDQIEMTRGSLRSVLDKNLKFPTRRTFYRWRQAHPDLDAEYDFVCAVRDDDEFDELLDLARNNDGSKDATRKAKLHIDTKKWVLAKRQPVTYGTERSEQHIKGNLGVSISAEQAEQLIRARANRTGV